MHETVRPALQPLNVRLKAAKVRFVQLELGILRVLYNLSERKKKGKPLKFKQTLRSHL